MAINWAGGLHHAKRSEASGFCYVNDIVLDILELLKVYERVLYIDIDVHHGDGVEEAFYTSDRVMALSFHKYGDYFPGTGRLDDIGYGKGRHNSVNVPLKDGIDDESYKEVFDPIVSKIIEVFSPSVIILQCGADSISGDKLGCFNLTQKGHGNCVSFVAKVWAYDTSMALGISLDKDIPYNEYIDYYGPHFKLQIPKLNIPNMNTKDSLGKIVKTVVENLRSVIAVPSDQMIKTPDCFVEEESDEEAYWDKLNRQEENELVFADVRHNIESDE